MYYASIGLLALVLHLIINHEVIANKTKNNENEANVRYRQFLFGLIVYYLSDSLWGFFAAQDIVWISYADTALYFASMTLSILLWVRYVVAYIDRKGLKSTSLTYAGYIIFGLSVIAIVVNFFKPIIFSFTEANEYVPGVARYIIFGVQFCLDVLLSVYSLIVSFKYKGRDSKRYRMVSASGAVMAFFIFLQTLFPNLPFYAIGCLIAACLVHVFVEVDEKTEQDRELQIVKSEFEQELEKTERVEKEKEIYTHIAESLAENYEAIYYIETETGKYIEFAVSELYELLNVQKHNENFYEDTLANIKKFVYPDDVEYALSFYTKEAVQRLLEGRKSYTFKYRVIVVGEPHYFNFIMMHAKDEKHFILCDKDIQESINAEKALREKHEKSITFGQIAESLAANYDVIYYIDIEDGSYVGYNTRNIYGQLEVERAGKDFYSESKKNGKILIHPQDHDKFTEFIDKDYMLSALENKKQIILDYRLIINDSVKYTRLFLRKSSDMKHFIIGVENVDDEVQREKEYLKTINTEKELARRDDLTGTKNKTAYSELEKSVQSNLDCGMDYLPFAIAVCDINNLKIINDTKGHKAGNEYIKAAAKLLCDIFDHSPVFRVGGDEFVVFLRGEDYSNRNELIEKFKETIRKNLSSGDGPVAAIGMADFNHGKDKSFAEVFERADNKMYEDKKKLKSGN